MYKLLVTEMERLHDEQQEKWIIKGFENNPFQIFELSLNGSPSSTRYPDADIGKPL
jgi:hypothetical protein